MVKGSKILCRACGAESEREARVCQKCGLSFVMETLDQPERKTICPRCQHANKPGSFFCYACGKYFADIGGVKDKRHRSTSLPAAPKAKIIMPSGAEFMLTGDPVFVERADFDGTLPYDTLMSISRQHILITYSRGKYYIQDYGAEGRGSTNHTKLNGIDIYGKKRKALKDGDKIELAGQPELTMIFRLLEEPNRSSKR